MKEFKSFAEFLEEKRVLAQDKDLKSKEGSTPAKTYSGLGKGTKEARHAHFQRNKDKADNDPSAYESAPGDAGGTKRESKHTIAFRKKFGEELEFEPTNDMLEEAANEILQEDGNVDTALKNKAEKTGYSVSHLRAIYNRGMAAFKGSHRPGANQHQWSLARVNSVITGGKARTSDKDIWEKMQASKKKKKK